MTIQSFFDFCAERERIRRLKDAGKPPPWTMDPVLRSAYFCNVFREDDRTTRWFRENLREPLRNDSRVIMATICFRWFNFIPTGEKIAALLRSAPWARAPIEAALRPGFAAGEKLVTGAFLVKSPEGTDKLTGLLRCMEAAVPVAESLTYRRGDGKDWTLENAHERLMEVPFLGPFMAYEVVTDLAHTHFLENAVDLDTWASAGPGCARGLQWVLGGPVYSYNSARGQAAMLEQMRALLADSRHVDRWPWSVERPWRMREVEHCLCEYDKYRRGQRGDTLKRKYRHA